MDGCHCVKRGSTYQWYVLPLLVASWVPKISQLMLFDVLLAFSMKLR